MRFDNSREDMSRFLVHLTRDYDGLSAKDNLINILNDKTIEARNAHCLVMHKIKEMDFSTVLQDEFCTVCFTEAPLTQIKQLVKNIEGRRIKLEPYGLVFWKEELFDRGASPAIYLNAKGTSVSRFLLDEFNDIFKNIKTLKKLQKVESSHYKNIVNYYSLINIVNDKHDFMWEREWRHHGDFKFKYVDIVAIIANKPDEFETLCKKECDPKVFAYLERLPVIAPGWTYEELIEEFAIKTWQKLSKKS